MGDADLEEIRAKRMAELRAQMGDHDESGSRNQQQMEEKRANEARNNILLQILDQSARARLNTLMVGKPEKGKMVEDLLLQMAKTGRVGGMISESELIRILEDINRQTSKTTKVKFDRRRAALDSDEDF